MSMLKWTLMPTLKLTRFLPQTLRARLTVLIVLSASVILALSGVSLYEALRNRIDAASADQMNSTMTALESHLFDIGSAADVAANTERLIDQLHGHRSLDLAIYDTDATLLLATRRFRPFPPTLAAWSGRAPVEFSRDSTSLRYLVSSVPLSRDQGMPVRVVLQYDATDDAALLRAHASTIALIEVLGIMLAAALAYGIAMLGLSPLRGMVARAEAMSSSRLAQPLPELETSGELKELERAFNGMLERLNESFTRLGQFSSNLAHDMRTPLTNLQAAAQVVLSQPRSADEYRDVIESSVDEYQRLSRMIEDMLFLARAENADAQIAVRRLDAVAEAERVAGYYEPMADDADIAIRVYGRAEIHADLLLYQRALSNLLSNALAHAPRGSTISIDCSETGDIARIAVSDKGAGIERQHLDRIFERFYRVDPSRCNSASGTGLGLAIVKSIMESHGGQCGVDSLPGRGATFWLSFPRARRGDAIAASTRTSR
ncbi:heavy metal sensor histidine kinase [Paraburkholderia bengalensis]